MSSIRFLIRIAALAGALLALGALEPPGASAGAYHVRSCFADGINHSWASYRSNAFADAYASCPQGVNGTRGLIARNVASSIPAPGYSHAKMYVNAPAGTYIDEIRFDGSVQTDRGWQAGVRDAQAGRWLWCGVSCNSFGAWFPVHLTGFASSSIEALAICGAGSCRSDGREVSSMAMRNVTVRLQDVWEPSVRIVGGTLAQGGWKSGVQTVEVEGGDNTGISALTASVDGIVRDVQTIACDDHLLVPCPGLARRLLKVDLREFADGAHTLEIRAADAGQNAESSRHTVLVDNSAPSAIGNLTSNDSRWQGVNSFSVGWENPPEKGVAPIAGAAYRLCPESSPALAACIPTRHLSKPQATALQGLSLPAPGVWRLRVWLVDAAGNQNDQTAREVLLRWDPHPPTINLVDRSASDPARIRVKASDTTSGLAATEIELRRNGDTKWHSLPVERTADGFTAVIDDEVFAAGTYAVRARARDHAGNEQSTESTPMSVRLPVRLETELAVGRSKVVKAGIRGRRRVLIRKPRADYGRRVRLSGRLTSPGGNPLAARDVAIFERLKLPGATWRPIATVRTGKSGRFKFHAPPGPNRLLRFRYAGTPTIQGRTSTVVLRIRATSTMRASRRRVVNGEEVTFRGRIDGRPIPPTGKLLQLQVYSRGSWLTFATPRASARGRWHHRYRFTATRGLTRYRFRVRLPREAGFPYSAGTSRTVGVRVVGL